MFCAPTGEAIARSVELLKMGKIPEIGRNLAVEIPVGNMDCGDPLVKLNRDPVPVKRFRRSVPFLEIPVVMPKQFLQTVSVKFVAVYRRALDLGVGGGRFWL